MIHSIKDILEVKAAEHSLAQSLPSDNSIDFGPITYSSCAWKLTKALLSPEHQQQTCSYPDITLIKTCSYPYFHYPDEIPAEDFQNELGRKLNHWTDVTTCQ